MTTLDKSLPTNSNQTKKCDDKEPRAGARSGDPEHHVSEPGLLSRGTQGHGPDLPGDTRYYRCIVTIYSFGSGFTETLIRIPAFCDLESRSIPWRLMTKKLEQIR